MAVAALTMRVNSRKNRGGVQVHDDTLVDELVYNQYDCTHVLYQRTTLDSLPENTIEAVVDAVQCLAEDQLVVLAVPDHEEGHVGVAAENRDIVVH